MSSSSACTSWPVAPGCLGQETTVEIGHRAGSAAAYGLMILARIWMCTVMIAGGQGDDLGWDLS